MTRLLRPLVLDLKNLGVKAYSGSFKSSKNYEVIKCWPLRNTVCEINMQMRAVVSTQWQITKWKHVSLQLGEIITSEDNCMYFIAYVSSASNCGTPNCGTHLFRAWILDPEGEQGEREKEEERKKERERMCDTEREREIKLILMVFCALLLAGGVKSCIIFTQHSVMRENNSTHALCQEQKVMSDECSIVNGND